MTRIWNLKFPIRFTKVFRCILSRLGLDSVTAHQPSAVLASKPAASLVSADKEDSGAQCFSLPSQVTSTEKWENVKLFLVLPTRIIFLDEVVFAAGSSRLSLHNCSSSLSHVPSCLTRVWHALKAFNTSLAVLILPHSSSQKALCGGWRYSSVPKCLLNLCKALDLTPRTSKQ